MNLSEAEVELMEKLVEAHNLWCAMDRQHPSEMQEWILSFHRLQDLILVRPILRSTGLDQRVRVRNEILDGK